MILARREGQPRRDAGLGGTVPSNPVRPRARPAGFLDCFLRARGGSRRNWNGSMGGRLNEGGEGRARRRRRDLSVSFLVRRCQPDQRVAAVDEIKKLTVLFFSFFADTYVVLEVWCVAVGGLWRSEIEDRSESVSDDDECRLTEWSLFNGFLLAFLK
jgi:hypothetical protein